MPLSKNISNYPPAFLDILTAMADREELELRLTSLREANNFRFQFYGFRRALSLARHPQELEAQALTVITRQLKEGGGLIRFTKISKGGFQLKIEEQLHALGVQTAKQRLAAFRLPSVEDMGDDEEREEMDQMLSFSSTKKSPQDEQAELIANYFNKKGK